jgi:hypothetical protein
MSVFVAMVATPRSGTEDCVQSRATQDIRNAASLRPPDRPDLRGDQDGTLGLADQEEFELFHWQRLAEQKALI